MTGLQSGTLDREITIEALVESSGTSRFPIESWTPLITLFAGRSDQGGSEAFRADQNSAISLVRWTFSFIESCDPEQIDVAKTRRVVYQGRIFDVLSGIQVGRQDGIQLTTRAKVG